MHKIFIDIIIWWLLNTLYFVLLNALNLVKFKIIAHAYTHTYIISLFLN